MAPARRLIVTALGDEEGVTSAASEFQPPGDAVAAFGVGVPDRRGDAGRPAHGGPPGGGDAQAGRRVHDDAVRLHVARDTHMLFR